MNYFIMRNTEFIGHTNDKKILNRFLKERSHNKFNILKINKIDEKIEDLYDFETKKLEFYPYYNRILSEYELSIVFSIARERMYLIVENIKELRKYFKFIKLNKEDEIFVTEFVKFIEIIEEDLDGYENCVFLEDYFDIKSILEDVIRYE